MMSIPMTGLSGAGKSSIAQLAKKKPIGMGYKVELTDGSDYRRYPGTVSACRNFKYVN